MTVQASVIIPTFRRPRDVRRCLESLQQQMGCDFEIIVVDNANEPETSEQVQAVNRDATHAALLLTEPRLGNHYARHTAASAANSDLLIFVDDDVTFAPGYVAAYVNAFDRNREMSAAGGPVRPVWEVPPPEWLTRLATAQKVFTPFSLMDRGDLEFTSAEGFFFSNNMAIRRRILFELGGFNPESFGGEWMGDGETGLNVKLWQRGMSIGYVPDALLYHHIPRSRLSLDYLLVRARNQGRADAFTSFRSHGGGLLSAAGELARGVAKSLFYAVQAIGHNGRTDPRSVELQTQCALSFARSRFALRLLTDGEIRRFAERNNWLEADRSHA